MRARIAVVVPTRDEVGDAPSLTGELLALPLDLRVLVMDDASTDGTVEALEAIAARDARVRLVRRSGPRGYGRACAEGLGIGLAEGAEYLVQMDGDGSHSPGHLPALLAAAESGADLVLGSRYLRGISVVNWPLHRLMLSLGANRYVRALTGLRASDCTSGYRLWRASALARVELGSLRSEGYAFQVESLFRAARLGARVAEVPIVFVERRGGLSKMSSRVILESALLPWALLVRRLLGRRRS
jgi:dolichol-phosphate mannosyltransferase